MASALWPFADGAREVLVAALWVVVVGSVLTAGWRLVVLVRGLNAGG